MADERSWTILSVLNWTAERFTRQGMASPRLDAEVLLAHCLDVDRIKLYTDYDKPLGAPERAAFRQMVKRRLDSEPVAYITGQKEFWSLPLFVDSQVLVPRPDTELLVEVVVSELKNEERREAIVVDVGTGSGAVAIALAAEGQALTIVATDVSQAALDCARRNAERHLATIDFHLGSLLEALPADLTPDLVVANLPYIPSADIADLMPDVGRFEPRSALDGGADGLSIIGQLIAQSFDRLPPDGFIALEIGAGQSDAVSALLATQGFVGVSCHADLGGHLRVVSARAPRP